MATKKVSYITLLKEAMKTVQEFDSSQLDITLPQVKQVLDYDGSKEIKTSEKTDASSILERYYFREENEPADVDELEDEIVGPGGDKGTLEDECLKREQEEEPEEKEEEGEEGEKEVLEAYRLFKEQEVEQSTEEAGTKKDMPLAKEPAKEVGDEDIVPEKEAGTLKEQDEEPEEKEEEVPETEIEEAEEKDEEDEEEEEKEEEEDAEKAVVEKLIAELEEEPAEEEEKKEGEEEEGKSKDEKKVEEGVGGAVVGGLLAGPGGAVAGHMLQKQRAQIKQLQQKTGVAEQGEPVGEPGKEKDEVGDQGEEDKVEEPLDVDKKLKEMLPGLPRAMANKNTEFEESKLIKEAQDAISYFMEEEEEEISSDDVQV